MIFGMTFWGLCWFIVKVIIGVSLLIFAIKLLLIIGLAIIAFLLD